LTGLVIGSLTPDFEYFLRMRIKSEYGHTIAGLFWFDLPLGILLTFLFHNIARNGFINNLPIVLKSRLFRFTQFDWTSHFKAHWFVVSVSVLIGAATHLLWDSFTHESGYFVSTFPDFVSTVELFGKKIPLFKIFQHGSTFIGGLIILVVLLKLPADNNINKHIFPRYWTIVITVTFIVVFIRIIFGPDIKLNGHLVATIISAVLIALTTTPLIASKRITGVNSA
jgi:hypothetical protein